MLLKTSATKRQLEEEIFIPEHYGDPLYKVTLPDGKIFMVLQEWSMFYSKYISKSVLIESREDGSYIHFVTTGIGKLVFGGSQVGARKENNKLVNLLYKKDYEYEVIEGIR